MRIIAGQWRGRRLVPLSGRDLRPTSDRVREAWMSAMGGTFPDARVVDLFAGSGALGLECLSRGAAHCTFVERAASSLRVLEANIERLGASEGTRIVRGDALAFVGALDLEPFDLAVADPPYGNGLALALAEAFLTRPFARELWLEHRSDESLPEVEGLRQRRYGDTTLSTFEVDPPSTPSSPT
jgi:16S rRNA (guanine966-N2)-methyltransferase